MSPDDFTRHLARLLSVADLSARLAPARSIDLGPLLATVARSTGAARVSVFAIEHADADDDEALAVTRLARFPDLGPPVAFDPRAVRPLLAARQSGRTSAIGPLSPADPFVSRHLAVEPLPPLFAAYAPTGKVVIELARDAAFTGDALAAVDDARATIGAFLGATDREATIAGVLRELLPEVLDEARAPTSLPARLRQFLADRRADPDERRAILLALRIADLGARSSAGLELAETMLAAIDKALGAAR